MIVPGTAGRSVAIALLAVAAGGVSSAANAQDDGGGGAAAATPPAGDEAEDTLRLEPVIVTARKWEELVRDVPQSVTVIPESFIRDGGIDSVRDASFFVPNLVLTEFSSRRLSFPTLRGVGSGQGDPAVATYIDGVPQLTTSSTNIALLDVERLEFLRGPQGTLFGRNSIGGLIQIVTKRPGNSFRLDGSFTAGNFDLFEERLSVSGPLKQDELFFSLSGLHSERDGYTTNDLTGNRVDDRRSTFGRGQLLWTPSERTEIRLHLYGETSRDGGFVLSDLAGLRANPFHIAQDFEGVAERDIFSSSVMVSHAADAFAVTSISAYQDWEILETSDFDFSFIDGVRRRTTESQDYFSQEIRFESPADAPIALDGGATLKWLIGGSVFTSDSTRAAANEFRPGGVPFLFPPAMVGTSSARGDFDDVGTAIFAQGTVTLDRRLDLTAGLRYDHESKEAEINNSFLVGGFPVSSVDRVFDESYDEFVPSFSAAYRIDDDWMVYGLAARGFKAGGFNLQSPAGLEAFAPETSWTYEIGTKTSLFDDRIDLAASIFYIDWDDLQLSQFDAMAGGYVANAGAATSRGAEIEVRARPTDDLLLFGSFGYTDAEFDAFIDQFGGDVAGNDLAFVPETTFSVGAQYGRPMNGGGRWYARGEYVSVGSFYYDAGNRSEESYGLANFRLGIASSRIRLEGWIRNAFDQEYVPVAFQPSPIDPTAFVGENGAPRTYGVTVSLTF